MPSQTEYTNLQLKAAEQKAIAQDLLQKYFRIDPDNLEAVAEVNRIAEAVIESAVLSSYLNFTSYYPDDPTLDSLPSCEFDPN